MTAPAPTLPVLPWAIGRVRRRWAHPLANRLVVTTGRAAPGAPVPVIGVASTGYLMRETLPALSLAQLPLTYRARPCRCALAAAEGECWKVSRPGSPDLHTAVLEEALHAAATHYARAAVTGRAA